MPPSFSLRVKPAVNLLQNNFLTADPLCASYTDTDDVLGDSGDVEKLKTIKERGSMERNAGVGGKFFDVESYKTCQTIRTRFLNIIGLINN